MAFGLISDTHNHNWSAFATDDENGVNSRLQIILDETWRAAKAVKEAGGDRLIHGGDLFHVRGKLSPLVLNPTIELYEKITRELDLKVIILSGNHDLESKESSKLSSAVSALGRENSIEIITEPTQMITPSNHFVLIPWFSSVEKLKMSLLDFVNETTTNGESLDNANLIIHAPVDGVIMNIPDHGLDPAWLADLGFKRVFSGHYHNHKAFDDEVYSIGALTHQTWGDVDTKAGFLICDDKKVAYNASHAPSFIDLDPTWSEEDVELRVEGNYVRAKVEVKKQSEVEALRQWLNESGAAGVVIHPVKDLTATSRTGSTVSTGGSMEKSVEDFIKSKGYDYTEQVEESSLHVLKKIEEVF